MELDDLKTAWNQKANNPVEDQPATGPAYMYKSGNQFIKSRLRKIILPELVGALVCLAAAAFIGFNFHKLGTDILKVAGIITIILLLLIPSVSAVSTWKLNVVKNLEQPHATVLRSFAKSKIRFIKLQKLNVSLGYLLAVLVIALLPGLVGGNDFSGNKLYWLFAFTFGFVFVLYYSRWVENYYRKILLEAEELLQELA